MNLRDVEHDRRHQHQRLLYQYFRARVRGDQASLDALRRSAETDPALARAIQNIELSLAREWSAQQGIFSAPPDQPEAEIGDGVSPALIDQSQPPDASSSAPPETSGMGEVPSADQGREPEVDADAPRPSDQDAPGRPHIIAERTAADYSSAVERRLSASLGQWGQRMQREGGAARSKALDLADLILKEPMAPSQRLRALHLCATLAREAQDYPRALEYMDDAVEISLRTGPPEVQMSLFHLRGRIHRGLNHVRHAIEDYRTCLAICRQLPDETRHPSSTIHVIEVVALVELAAMEFILALYPTSERHSAEAATKLSALQHASLNASLMAATLEWLRALLHRWRGQPELALRPAAHALELLETIESTSAASRLHGVTAEITMDMAERLPVGTDRWAITKLASSHIDSALDLARASDDKEALALAQIAFARCSRSMGSDSDRRTTLEAVYQRGRAWNDEALQAQALTALAQEWSARGEAEQALTCYRKTLDLTDGSDVAALGVWAHRALLQASEMRRIP